MFTLVTDRSKYLRIRRNVAPCEVERLFKIPVCGETFAGRIIELTPPCEVYVVRPAETYASISLKTGVEREELEKLNGFKPIYPSCKLFVPCKK